MPITQDDIRFRASERMTDFADGGGRMSTVVIVDGVDNNLFDDITDIERLDGALSLRKVFGAVLSENQDTYLSAHAIADVPPADAATDCFIMTTGGVATERAAAVAALESWHRLPGNELTGYMDASPTRLRMLVGFGYPGTVPVVGQVIGVRPIADDPDPVAVIRAVVTEVSGEYTGGVPGGGSSLFRNVTFDRSLGFAPDLAVAGHQNVALSETRIYGVSTVTAGPAAAATSVTVDSATAQVVPYTGTGDYPTENHGIDPAPFEYSAGRVAWVRKNDALLLHSTQSMAPAAVSNGQTVNTGRTALARLRVIGNSGVVHATFISGQPAPVGVGCTADLAAGTVTFSDVSGYSQPVTVEHRIEELIGCASVTGDTLGFNRPLARAFPAGTRVSSLLRLGDLKGRATNVAFAQTAWTDVWSDTVIGGSPAADFDVAGHPIECTNEGAVTERWYVRFTNTTSFQVVGEQLGVIGTGGIGADYAPINPATGAPYFTLRSLGWGAGWSAGNVFRFNTQGANVPIWVGRCVAPSVPSGDDSVTLQLRGYVNT